MFTKEQIRVMEPVKEINLPINRLALEVLGWAALAALSFFFHLVAFLVVLAVLIQKASMFRFVYENTRIPNDPDFTEHPVTIIRHEPTFRYTGEESFFDYGTELGTVGEGNLRKNLPESKE